jgi:hypothetical protein
LRLAVNKIFRSSSAVGLLNSVFNLVQHFAVFNLVQNRNSGFSVFKIKRTLATGKQPGF